MNPYTPPREQDSPVEGNEGCESALTRGSVPGNLALGVGGGWLVLMGFVSALPGGLWIPLTVSVVLGLIGAICSKTRVRKAIGVVIFTLAAAFAFHDWMMANAGN